jgi:nickel-dependent lactate racemase
VGVTARGTPIEVCEPVVRADVRVALGAVEYHYFAGYSGGAKALVPGACSAATIRHNHAMMVDPQARAGILDGNPVREDIEEGAALVGIDFILNVIMDEGQVVLAAAGHPVQAHRWACQAVDYLSAVPLARLADIVVVSAGGFPKDINLYQAQKALESAGAAVRAGGVIIWVAECREGLGNATFEQWMVGASADAIMQRIRQEFVIGGHKAAAIAAIQQRATIYLVSSLPAALVRDCGMEPYTDVAAALASARSACGPMAHIVVMPEGASLAPQVAAVTPPDRSRFA